MIVKLVKKWEHHTSKKIKPVGAVMQVTHELGQQLLKDNTAVVASEAELIAFEKGKPAIEEKELPTAAADFLAKNQADAAARMKDKKDKKDKI